MPIPENKEELLDAIEYDFQKLRAEIMTIDGSKLMERSMIGHAKGTSMSIHNLVSYLVGWGELVIKWHDKKAKGQVVDFPEKGFKWTELGLLAQKFYVDYESLSFPALMMNFEDVVDQIIKIVEQSTNEDLYQNSWYKSYPMGRMIQLNTSSPYKNALTRIKVWKKDQQK